MGVAAGSRCTVFTRSLGVRLILRLLLLLVLVVVDKLRRRRARPLLSTLGGDEEGDLERRFRV